MFLYWCQLFLQKLSDFPVKTDQFSYKNCKIFLKKLSTFAVIFLKKFTTSSLRKILRFLKKICRFSHENLTVFTRTKTTQWTEVLSVSSFWRNLAKMFHYAARNTHVQSALRIATKISNCQTRRLDNGSKYLHCSYRPLPVHAEWRKSLRAKSCE